MLVQLIDRDKEMDINAPNGDCAVYETDVGALGGDYA